MKYMAALIVSLICLPVLADDMEMAIEDAKAAGIEAINEAAQIDPAEFEIRIESDEQGDKYYYRRDKLVLIRRKDIPVYRLCRDGIGFGNVVVEKDYSPQILLEKNLDFGVNLIALGESALELSFYGTDPDFLEAYIVTSESVRPISAERYLERLDEAVGSRAAFESIFDSLIECEEPAEAR